jgi:hypothetical protein
MSLAYGNPGVGPMKVAAYNKVVENFGKNPDSCQDLDKRIKLISDSIGTERKKYPNPSEFQRYYVEEMEFTKNSWTNMFAKRGCRDIIENIRLQSAALTDTKFAIQSEKQVLGESNKNQNLYIGMGAIIILVGLFVVLE